MENKIIKAESVYEAPDFETELYETEDIVTASALDNDFKDPWGIINK